MQVGFAFFYVCHRLYITFLLGLTLLGGCVIIYLLSKSDFSDLRGKIMLTVFSQVFMLFTFIAVGYLIAKLGIVKSEHSKILSSLLVYVFSVGNTFKAYSQNCTVEYIKDKYVLILAGAVVLIALAVPMHFAGKLFSRDNYEQKVFEYSLVLANYGYFGYPMVENLLGPEALTDFMMFCLPTSIYIYAYAYGALTGGKGGFKKMLNPPMIAMLIGAAVGLLSIPMPAVVTNIASNANACMGPVAMLLAGVVMSDFKITKLVSRKSSYVLCVMRLLVIPLAIGGIVWCAMSALSLTDNGVARDVYACIVFFTAMPCGLNTIIFPRLADKNCELGASFAFISNILACVTIPVVLTVLGVS